MNAVNTLVRAYFDWQETLNDYSSFSYLLIRIRLEENIIKEKESNNYSLVA